MDDKAPAGQWAAWREPGELVQRTRRLFFLLVLISVALMIGPTLDAPPSLRPGILLGCLWLIGGWALRYRWRRSPALLDLGEVAATTALGALLPDPAVVFTFVFAALWFRGLYGSTTRILVFSAGIAVGVAAALVLWSLVPGRGAPPSVEHVLLGGLPSVFLTVTVSRYLALGLFAREQAQRRDTALSRLGRELLGITERSAIQRLGRACAGELCAVTPGLRILTVIAQEDALRVVTCSGLFADAPDALPPELVPPSAAVDNPDVWAVPDRAFLRGLAGEDCHWVAMPLVDQPGWFLVGSPRRVRADVVVAVETMDNHVALALRNSDAHEDLASQARVDALTGLANRAAFTGALALALAQPEHRLAVLFLDLDDFKLVNDGLGHAAGDDLLRHVAARMRQGIGPEDLCARLGGDEFGVLMPDGGDSAVAAAERLVELVAAPVHLRGQLARVGASVGVAFSAAAAGAAPLEQLMHQADTAMYAAKAKGKNRVQEFDPSLLREDGQVVLDNELGAAAAAGQLVVHYQPILTVADGVCVAVEALVRWQHPTRGLMAPAEFFPAAERTGAVVGLGSVVLRQACADAASWSRRFGRVDVHVNVSARQLTDPGFLDLVRGCILEFELAPKQLVLEVTEGMVLESEEIRAALDPLGRAGAAIAIDDFGTGVSALSTIRALPLDVIKLDESVIAGGGNRQADVAVVGAIVAMAGQLGLRVVAEGVERLDQQQFLERAGVDTAQGYLYLRPTPAAELAEWLVNNRRSRAARGVGCTGDIDPPPFRLGRRPGPEPIVTG